MQAQERKRRLRNDEEMRIEVVVNRTQKSNMIERGLHASHHMCGPLAYCNCRSAI